MTNAAVVRDYVLTIAAEHGIGVCVAAEWRPRARPRVRYSTADPPPGALDGLGAPALDANGEPTTSVVVGRAFPSLRTIAVERFRTLGDGVTGLHELGHLLHPHGLAPHYLECETAAWDWAIRNFPLRDRGYAWRCATDHLLRSLDHGFPLPPVRHPMWFMLAEGRLYRGGTPTEVASWGRPWGGRNPPPYWTAPLVPESDQGVLFPPVPA